MSAKYERTFVVAVPVERAWAAFAEPAEREAWMGTPPPGMEPVEIKVGDVEPHRSMSWSQTQSGLDGWYETTVTFEEVSSGTRITIVRSGFGDSEDWRHYVENTSRGFDESLADLILYLETGVKASRHFQFLSGIAATTHQSSTGVRITHVIPGGFAAGAGLRSGDLLLRLNGAPVLGVSDIAFACREHAPGSVIEAEYVRGSDVQRGSAPLSEWNFGANTYVGHPGGYPKATLTGA